MTIEDPDPALVAARIRSHQHAVVVIDGDPMPSPMLIDPRTGAMILSIPPDQDDLAESIVAMIPDESDGSVQVLLGSIRDALPGESDRFQGHFGTTFRGHLVAADPEAVRVDGGVIDGETLSLKNPWADREGNLLRSLNAAPGRLGEACRRHGLGVLPEPVAVGVDPDGVTVRARTGVVRLGFAVRAESGESAAQSIDAMLDELLGEEHPNPGSDPV